MNNPENIFGQVMICLRMSKLDYLVKETPYSAYVTIRKKFLKSVKEELNCFEAKDAIDNITEVQKVNSFLKTKITELEDERANLKVINNEMGIKIETLVKDKVALIEEIEEGQADIKAANSKNETMKKKNNVLEKDTIQLKDVIKNLNGKIENKEETIQILEFTVKSKHSEIQNLQAKLVIKKDTEVDSDSDSQKASTSGCNKVEEQETHNSCDTCSFETKNHDALMKHMQEEHTEICDYCDFDTNCKKTLELHLEEKHKFICKKCKLAHNEEWRHNIHVCKLNIENPRYRTFYTKAWLDQNGCNVIYCEEQNEEVAWLHNHKCWSGEIPCFWTPGYLDKDIEPGAVRHLKYSEFVEDARICWLDLCKEFK